VAKRRYTRKRTVGRTLVYLPFNVDINLGTMTDNQLIPEGLQTLTQDFDVVGVKAAVSFTGVTAGEGPIEAGWNQAELTGAQVIEQRDASPTSQWDVLANEQSKRKVRMFGTSSGLNDSLNDGKPIWRKMFLRVPAGKTLCDLYVLNRSGATLTTGQVAHFQGAVVGYWK